MVNKLILVGRIGQDPEMKQLQNSSVTNFSVATSEKWTDQQGEKQERTEWHRVQAWGKLGEICAQYLKKGSLVFIEGKLRTRSWETQSGEKRYATEVIANSMQMLGSKSEEQGQAAEPQPRPNVPNYAPGSSNPPPQQPGGFDYDEPLPF